MKKLFKKIIILFLAVLFILPSFNANAYVSVKGYYRKNGTYVAPYVRSNPNGVKYDNYGIRQARGFITTHMARRVLLGIRQLM